uniref:RNA polymerase II subunit A C-terminal domain phosphatase SSU72 n=1 Tax=Leptocylindrus danicus TaxID=163516 RepID=A0A7S2P062_9STRA|mmetsp:Transcript_19786/g.29419  ORF Transcript_19786/g.29419 Transcript_19786/m.29419 type:complete len:233 (+) Transcript_19786:53-751(+)
MEVASESRTLPRPVTPPIDDLKDRESVRRRNSKLSFGVVCSSNINRSMEAHVVLGNAGLNVESYGTGTNVRLPGRSAMEPQVFKFGTPYAQMYDAMSGNADDQAFFTHNGVLQLCRRGAAVKLAPQRWQDTPNTDIANHDVVIAFEERIFDAVVDDLGTREPDGLAPLLIICLDTKDNPHEARLQGKIALDLCWRLEHCDNLEEEHSEILDQFEEERMTHTPIKLLYQLCYL